MPGVREPNRAISLAGVAAWLARQAGEQGGTVLLGLLRVCTALRPSHQHCCSWPHFTKEETDLEGSSACLGSRSEGAGEPGFEPQPFALEPHPFSSPPAASQDRVRATTGDNHGKSHLAWTWDSGNASRERDVSMENLLWPGNGGGGVRCSKQRDHRCPGLEARGKGVCLGNEMELFLLGLLTGVCTCVHIFCE